VRSIIGVSRNESEFRWSLDRVILWRALVSARSLRDDIGEMSGGIED
jgi:hypothetical protein